MAVKLWLSSADDKDLRQKVWQLGSRAAALNHPGIAGVLDVGETNGPLAYIVMEFVDGRVLSKIIPAHGRAKPLRAAGIVSDVCDALNYGHQNGVVHGNLSAGNMMLTSGGAVKLLNFGLTRTRTELTPKQHRDDTQIDIRSAGLLLRQLVTGVMQVSGQSLPSPLTSGIPLGLNDIIRKAMEKRYPTASDMRRDLMKVLTEHG